MKGRSHETGNDHNAGAFGLRLDFGDVLGSVGAVSKRSWIGGGNEMQHDKDRRVEQQRQVDQARADVAEQRTRRQDAVIQLAKAREQLLALSILMYERARLEEAAGEYDLADWLHDIGRMARDIRANQTVDVLEAIGTHER